ncbi:hypothetical protein K466DRAFT_170677 [Polyporus arcularius HHB13444]|uniref:Uncharacterized protein n=1 Tax=Polyporus arcularius HHB13444 TaxID=1314778 RepID=A0A5C3P8Z8_9APHY|nr:hypothetical protein K466DRAFT_170677 [Polyporus arcularius HHB13444]
MMQIELSSRWGSSPLREADDNPPPAVVPWYVHQQGLCLKKIRDTRPTYLLALTGFLVPGSLHLLHLAFENWSHCEEMGRFLKHVGEFITGFTITFGHALSYFEFRQHIPTEDEWASYGFSHLRNLSKLRFDLDEPLTCNFANEPKSWLDSAGIPRFLACFPRTLPLRDGVDIDLRYVGDIVGHGYGMVEPRPEIDGALLRFENLDLVALCPSSSYGCDLAVDIGAEAFPRLWETRKLACMDEVEESCCP